MTLPPYPPAPPAPLDTADSGSSLLWQPARLTFSTHGTHRPPGATRLRSPHADLAPARIQAPAQASLPGPSPRGRGARSR